MKNNQLITITYNGEAIQVSPEVAAYLDEVRKEKERQRKRDKRHLSDKPVNDDYIEEYMRKKPDSFLDDLISALTLEQVKKQIDKLPEIQKRRFNAYYFMELTYQQIAERDGCSFQAVALSVKTAERKIRKSFEMQT